MLKSLIGWAERLFIWVRKELSVTLVGTLIKCSEHKTQGTYCVKILAYTGMLAHAMYMVPVQIFLV